MFTQRFQPRYSRYAPFAEQEPGVVGHIARMRQDRERRAVELAEQDGRAAKAAEKLRAAFSIGDYYSGQLTAIVTWVWRGDYPNKAGEAIQRLVELKHVPANERRRAEMILSASMKERETCRA
jgi:hypothetical protein